MLDNIKQDIKRSLLTGDRFRAETLKLVQASLQNAKISKMEDLSTSEEVAVVQKEIKKRKEAAEMFSRAGSIDKEKKELKELEIIEEFVPKQTSGIELEKLIDSLISSGKLHLNSFPEAMRLSLELIENADRAQLAGILKQKIT